MEAKMHVPVDRQTCHVIPDTNRTTRRMQGESGNIFNIISHTIDCNKIFSFARDRITAPLCISMRENPRRVA
jgi:hypothetical protein